MPIAIRTVSMLVILALTLLLPGCGASAAPKTGFLPVSKLGLLHPGYLTVGTDPSNPPLESVQSGKVVGADIDLISAMARVMGLKGITVVRHPFSTLLPALRQHKFDVVLVGMNDTPQRRQQAAFVDYMKSSMAIVVRKTSSLYLNSLAYLCGHSVAVASDTTDEDQLRAANKHCTKPMRILSVGNGGEITPFLHGKTEALAEDLPLAVYIVHHHSNLRLAGKAISSGQNYGIALSPDNANLRHNLLAALAKLMSSGQYDRILARWGLTSIGY